MHLISPCTDNYSECAPSSKILDLPLQVYQISAELEYEFASYSDFFKCAERQRRKKPEEKNLKVCSLIL